ncbi:MAG: glycosyltransferase family 2 protein [Thermoleophilia bacterium]
MSGAGNPAQKVRCIMVNYRSPWDMLARCLDSLTETGGNKCAVTLVDNASGDGMISRVRAAYPDVRIIEMPGNAGFAHAVNRGIDDTSEPYVLLLNTDAVLTPGALVVMQSALEAAGADCAGIAPKMMSSAHEGVIDAVGTVMPTSGASFNRGIGQCDLGQYDQRDEVFGTCFGASLLQRRLFDKREVGPLYEGYFLYFEDSDWCLRARSQGYRFLVEPDAVVLHMHSGVTRNETLAFKYRLIELNTLKVVVRNFESPRQVAGIVCARGVRLLARTFIRRKFIRANLSTLASFLVGLPELLRERKELGRNRIASDRKVFELAKGEAAYFDTVEYRPDRCLDSLIDTYLRLIKSGGDPVHGHVLAVLYNIRQQSMAGKNIVISEETRALLDEQPGCVKSMLGMLLAG